MDLLNEQLDSISSLKNPEVLHEAYCGKGLSLGQIARRTGTTKSHVHYYMVKFNIERRLWTGLTPKRDPNTILKSYKEGKTLREISSLIGISKSTAWGHISKHIQLRPRSIPRYPRSPFSNDETEKAYLLGFRAGDVNAFQDSTLTVTARVSTTHRAMLDMFQASFSSYGHCVMVPRRAFLTGYDWQIKAYLDNTFRFLISKPREPPSGTAFLYAFVSGFSDSDGCWSVTEKRGRTIFSFDITSSSHILLMRLAKALEREGYHPHVYLSRKKGTVKVVNGQTGIRLITLTKDTWDLVLRRKSDVRRLASNVLPYSRHPEKIAKMKLILDSRNEDWKEMGPKFEELRANIELETKETISRAATEYKARHREPASGVVG